MSEATRNSSSPMPTTMGGPLRTPTILSGSSAWTSDDPRVRALAVSPITERRTAFGEVRAARDGVAVR